MRRVLFRWRGREVRSFAVFVYIGLVLGIFLGFLQARTAALPATSAWAAMLLLAIPFLVGSRLLFILSHWHIYRREPARIWRRSEGGAASFGGLLLLVPVSIPLLYMLRLPLGSFYDVLTFPILVVIVFTRIGCLLNGCCAGRPTTSRIGLLISDRNGVILRRIPTQLLEAGWAALLLLSALAIRQRLPFPGALFVLMAMAYGSGRFMLEFTRERSLPARSLTLAQMLSLGLVVLGLAGFGFAMLQGS